MVQNASAEAVFNFKKLYIRTLLSCPQCFVSLLSRFLRKISTLITMQLHMQKLQVALVSLQCYRIGAGRIRFSLTETGFPAKCFIPISFWCLCMRKGKTYFPLELLLTTHPSHHGYRHHFNAMINTMVLVPNLYS